MPLETNRKPPTWLERVFFWTCLLSTAIPLVSTRYLPFTDLPEHVAVMSTLSRWFDATSGDAGTYQMAFWKSQYLVYHGAEVRRSKGQIFALDGCNCSMRQPW